MSYMNDPREQAIRIESGVTLEENNRYERMYHWGAMVLDLCDLPVEEYMKPMTVNVNGVSSGSSTGETTVEKNVSIWVKSYQQTLMGADGDVSTLDENDIFSITWVVEWKWTGSFSNEIKSVVTVKAQDPSGVYVTKTVVATLVDNAEKCHRITFTLESSTESTDEKQSTIDSCAVGNVNEASSSIVDDTYVEKSGSIKYTYKISTDEEILSNSEKIYYGVYPYLSNLANVTVADLSELEANYDEDTLMSFVIKGATEEQMEKYENGEITEDELLKAVANYFIVLVKNESKNKFNLFDELGNAVNDFEEDDTINVDGYTAFVRKDYTTQTALYVEDGMTDSLLKYKIKITK